MSIYLEPIEGDLTRVGRLSENSFGWQQQQPNIPIELLKNHPLAEADIAVIGDSFSASLVWQTKLAASGYKISTTWINEKTLCSNIGDYLRLSGFKGRYIVIESLERFAPERINNDCNVLDTTKWSYRIEAPRPPPPTDRSRNFMLKSRSDFNLGWMLKALKNEIVLNAVRPKEGLMAFGDARITVLDEAGLFSNKLYNYGVFYAFDFEKKTFDSDSTTDKVLSLNRNLQQTGMQPIWLIVPDKSTVYLGYGKFNKHPYVNIWNELAQYPELAAPNLGELFTKQAKLTMDFYAPNNTHLSTQGYLYLGDLVLERIKQLDLK